MTFKEKIKLREFWVNSFKVALVFFITLIVVSLLIESWRAIFAGNFDEVYNANFGDEKWKSFFGFKIFFSILYSIYITNKKMK